MVGIFQKVHKKIGKAITIVKAVTFSSTASHAKAIGLTGVNTDNAITWSGTNTGSTPAFIFPDDTYIADADGAIGGTAGFIVVQIGGSAFKLQTYAES